MKKIVTASTNPIVIKTITNACKSFATFSCNIFGDTDSIISFINYELHFRGRHGHAQAKKEGVK